MADEPGFEVLDHTADLALRARGTDLRDLIERAAAGLLHLLYTEPPPSPGRFVTREVEAESPELLLQHSLRELLYLLEDEAAAPVAVAVLEAGEGRALLRVGVRERAELEPLIGSLIKAVTRHGLAVEAREGLLEVTIVFDV